MTDPGRADGDGHPSYRHPRADRPREGSTSAYDTVFRDGDRYRMYYRGAHLDEKTKRAAHREVTCYAESRDGLH
jgi:hypothetical protein